MGNIQKIELEHPTDEMGLALGRAPGVLHLLHCNWEGTKKDGAFQLSEWFLYQGIYDAMQLVDHAVENLERLTQHYEVPFRSKAEITVKHGQS
jgi:hypothetical protein